MVWLRSRHEATADEVAEVEAIVRDGGKVGRQNP